jgi:SAM-dependent methyltransferase
MLKSTILDEIGRKHGTDKCAGPGSTHDYLRKYEFFFRPLREKAFTFLELGVYKGASLRVWSEYFTQAKIYGVDIEPSALNHAGGRAEVLIGDLAKNDFLQSLIDLQPAVVLDDASHWWPDQLRALFTLYPALSSGGLYIIEDIHTSFEPLAPHFSAGIDTPPFEFILKIAEYMTGNDQNSPILRDQKLVPLERYPKFDEEIRYLADRTDAVTFIERACLLVKK